MKSSAIMFCAAVLIVLACETPKSVAVPSSSPATSVGTPSVAAVSVCRGSKPLYDEVYGYSFYADAFHCRLWRRRRPWTVIAPS